MIKKVMSMPIILQVYAAMLAAHITFAALRAVKHTMF